MCIYNKPFYIYLFEFFVVCAIFTIRKKEKGRPTLGGIVGEAVVCHSYSIPEYFLSLLFITLVF